MHAPEPASRASALLRIRTAMIEKKLTQAELADAADCHEKTIQNLVNGRSVRDQTLFDVCMVLGLDFDELKATWSGGAREAGTDAPGKAGESTEIAPLYMGAYTRAGVDHCVGKYLTVRPSFSVPNTLVAYRTDITWDAGWPSLVFQEYERPDSSFSHRGRLYIPASSMFIHFVSLTKGAMRSIVVSQLDQAKMMRGIITTLHKRGPQLIPCATPMVFQQLPDFGGVAFGEIKAGTASYGPYHQMLADCIEQGYARLVTV
jgi:transcriptional regulator with XRE-family HTH domain